MCHYPLGYNFIISVISQCCKRPRVDKRKSQTKDMRSHSEGTRYQSPATVEASLKFSLERVRFECYLNGRNTNDVYKIFLQLGFELHEAHA